MDQIRHELRLCEATLSALALAIALFPPPASGLALVKGTRHASSPPTIISQTSSLETADRISQEADELFANEDYEGAIARWQEATELYKLNRDWLAAANRLSYIGLAFNYVRDLEQALSAYEQSLELLQQVEGNEFEKGKIFHSVGSVYFDLENWEQALNFYRQALPLLEIAVQQGNTDRLDLANTLYWMGRAYTNLREWQQAIAHYNQALVLLLLYEKANEPEQVWLGQSLDYWKAEIFYWLGISYRESGAYNDAYNAFSQAQMAYHETQNRSREADALSELGLILEDRSQFNLALQRYQQALAIRQDLCRQQPNSCTQDEIVRLLVYVAKIFYELGDSRLGENYLNQSLNLLSEVENPGIKANIFSNIGYTLAISNRPRQSLSYLYQAVDYAIEAEDWVLAARTRNSIAATNIELEIWSDRQHINYLLEEVLPLLERGEDKPGIAAMLRTAFYTRFRLLHYHCLKLHQTMRLRI
jgi:tetratricopeptide (TPR) repeat protein